MAQIKFFKISQATFDAKLNAQQLTAGGIYFLTDAARIYVATGIDTYDRYSDQVRYLDAVPENVSGLQKDVVYIVRGDNGVDSGVYVNDNGLKKIGVTDAELQAVKAIADANKVAIGKKASEGEDATGLYAQIETAKTQAIAVANAITNNSLVANQVVVATDEKSVKTTGYTIGAGTLTDIKESGETPVYSDKTLATEKAVASAISAVSAAAIGVEAGDGISIATNGTLNTISTDIKIEKLTTANEGATATYQLQIKEAGKNTYKAAGVAIDIPKDMVATKGELVDRKEGETEATGTYIKMTIANGEAFYINVAELIEYNSYEDSTTIDATEVVAGTHTYKFDVKDGSIGTAKLDTAVKASLALADTALQSGDSAENIEYKEESGETAAVTVKDALDDLYKQIGSDGSVATQIKTAIENLDSAIDTKIADTEINATNKTVNVIKGFSIEDGELTDSVTYTQLTFNFDAAGAAAAVLGTAADTADKATVYGVKAYADQLVADLDADLDAVGTAAKDGTFVVSGVTQVDGKITAVDSVEVEKAGAAAAALDTAKAYTDAALKWEEL